MRLLKILGFEMRAWIRAAIPVEMVRRAVCVILPLAAAFLSVVVVTAPGANRRLAVTSIGSLAGFSIAMVGLSASVSLLGGAALLRQPARARLYQLAPIPDAARVLIPLGALVLLSAMPWALFAAPVLAMTLRFAPAAAATLTVLGVLTVSWSFVAATGVLLLLARQLGRERAGRVAGALGAALPVFTVLMFQYLVRISLREGALWLAIVWLTVMLPVVGSVVMRSFLSTLSLADHAVRLPDPDWGRPGWGRMFLRTPGPWAALGLLPAMAMVALRPVPFKWGLIAVFLLAASLTPQTHLWAAEYTCPDRWRLAPAGRRMRASLLLRVGGTATAALLIVAVAIGTGHPLWLFTVSGLLILAPPTFLLSNAWLRNGAQGALCVSGLLTSLLS